MAKKKSNSGRKPVEPSEKVIQVNFYTKQKFVDQAGGMDQARLKAKLALESDNYQLVPILCSSTDGRV